MKNQEKKSSHDVWLEFVETITEKPHWFELEGEKFSLFPKTLGKIKLLLPLYEQLDINKNVIALNPNIEAIRLSQEKPDLVCLIIAYDTFRLKDEILNEILVKQRADFFKKHLTTEDMAILLIATLTEDEKNKRIMDFLRITEALELKRKICALKKNKDSVSIGGCSLYGLLVDFAMARYGWTLDYVMWGISYANLQMLYFDQPVTVQLTEKERRKLHIFNDSEVIDAGDPKNRERVREMLKNQ